MAWSVEYQRAVEERLQRLDANRACHRCGNPQHHVLPGFVSPMLQTEPANLIVGSPQVPCVAVVCAKCGALTTHALGVIGMMPVVREEPKPEGSK